MLPARNNWDLLPLLESLQEHTDLFLPSCPREHRARVTTLPLRFQREKPTWGSELQFSWRGKTTESISELTWTSQKGWVLPWAQLSHLQPTPVILPQFLYPDVRFSLPVPVPQGFPWVLQLFQLQGQQIPRLCPRGSGAAAR